MRIKSKYVGLLLGAVFFSNAAHAVVLATTLMANSSNNVGLITTDISGLVRPVTGRAFIYSTSVEISAADVAYMMSRVAFEALILSDPGMVRANIAFANGAVTSAGMVELGAAGNKTYVWMSMDDDLSWGLFQGPNVPALGAVTLNSATMTEDLIGTSSYSAIGTSGFQLAYVPEPSAALLGAIGALGLLRRRRI